MVNPNSPNTARASPNRGSRGGTQRHRCNAGTCEGRGFVEDSLRKLRISYELILISGVLCWATVEWFLGLFARTRRKDVAGQLVLVTGGANGLGREISSQFASLGCDVIIADVDKKSASVTVEDIRKDNPGARIKFYQTDVSKPEEVDDLKSDISRDFGRDVDILVNNAGVMDMVSFEDDASVFRRTIDVNFLAHVWTIRAFLPKMIENERGLIVAVASEAVFSGGRYGAAYCSSKTAVKTMMESLKDDLKMRGHRGVDVCCALPYFMDTDQEMLDRFKFIIPPICPKYAAKELISNALRNVFCFTIPTTHFYFMAPLRAIPEKIKFTLLNWLLPRLLGMTMECDEIISKQKLKKLRRANGFANVTLDVNK